MSTSTTLKKHANRIALWVKEYADAFKVFGALFFFLSFICGIFWIYGKEVEPVAFVLSLISSVFFAAPSVANYFAPDRKPIRHMSFKELLQFIENSNPTDDWEGLHLSWASEYFLSEDPRLRFRTSITDEDTHCDDFKEEWANRHPNPNAQSYYHNLYYDGNLIERFILVSVDGARAMLPLPDWETGEIQPLPYKVAKIVDSLESLDEYIQRSGLTVKKNA